MGEIKCLELSFHLPYGASEGYAIRKPRQKPSKNCVGKPPLAGALAPSSLGSRCHPRTPLKCFAWSLEASYIFSFLYLHLKPLQLGICPTSYIVTVPFLNPMTLLSHRFLHSLGLPEIGGPADVSFLQEILFIPSSLEYSVVFTSLGKKVDMN